MRPVLPAHRTREWGVAARQRLFHFFICGSSLGFVEESTLTVNADELRSRTRNTSLPSANSSPGASRVGAEMRFPLT